MLDNKIMMMVVTVTVYQ